MTESPLATDVKIRKSGRLSLVTWISAALFVALLCVLAVCEYVKAPRIVETPLLWSVLVSAIATVVALGAEIAGALLLGSARTLWVEGDTLVVQTERKRQLLPLDALVEGWHSPGEQRVYLQTRHGDVYSAAVRDDAAGQALLERVGLDAAKRTWRMRLGPVDFLTAMSLFLGVPFALAGAALIITALHMGAAGGLSLMAFFCVGQYLLVRGLFAPAHLVIGADGVIVKQRLRRRFVSFEELDSVTTAPNEVTLHLRDGRMIRARARNLHFVVQSAIQERIAAAAALHRGRAVEPGALAQLDKGARTAAEWRAALSGLLAQDGSYRTARLTREQVLGVLENPAAPAGRRLGAAIALARAADPEAVTRARIAAAASANDRMRIAFEKVAAGALDDAAIDEAAAAEDASKKAAPRMSAGAG